MLPSSSILDDADDVADDVVVSLASAPNVPLCSKTTSLLLLGAPVTLFGVDSVVARLLPTAALEEERKMRQKGNDEDGYEMRSGAANNPGVGSCRAPLCLSRGCRGERK
jgi:hypothetical protein